MSKRRARGAKAASGDIVPCEVNEVAVKILLSENCAEYVDDLIAIGLFGVNRADVCARMVDAGVAQLIRDGVLSPLGS